MTDSSPGTPAAETGARDQGPNQADDTELRAAAMRDEEQADDDVAIRDDLGVDPGGPPGPHSAGDSLGGDEPPVGSDGTSGGEIPTGDASLAETELDSGGDSPGDVYGDD